MATDCSCKNDVTPSSENLSRHYAESTPHRCFHVLYILGIVCLISQYNKGGQISPMNRRPFKYPGTTRAALPLQRYKAYVIDDVMKIKLVTE